MALPSDDDITDGRVSTVQMKQYFRDILAVIRTLEAGGSPQPLDAGLTSIAALVTAADKMLYTTALDTYAVTDLTAFARTLLDDVDAATARTTLGLGTAATTASTDYATAAQGTTADTALQPAAIGTTVQAQSTSLDNLTTITTGKVPVKTGGGYADSPISTSGNDATVTTGSMTLYGGTAKQIDVGAEATRTASTGVFSGGAITIGTPTTTYDVASGTGVIVDAAAGTYTPVTWGAISGTTPAANGVRYIYINSGGTITETGTAPTAQNKRENIYLGRVIVSSGTVTQAFGEPVITLQVVNQLYDLAKALRLFNIAGNELTANGANLSFNKAAGSLFSIGAGFASNAKIPHRVDLGASTPVTFQHMTQTASTGSDVTVISPGNYDVGGTITAIPGGPNQATNMRVYLFPSGSVRVAYGQTIYASLNAAITGLATAPFVENPDVAGNGVLIGVLSVTSGATALNNTTQARFLRVSRFGETAVGGSGASVTDLQGAYNNSSTPEIIVDATRGALTVQDAATPIGAPLFEVQSNGGGTTYLAVNASGATVTGNIAVTGTVDGRDIAVDGAKLDGIEAGADVTDSTNVLSSLAGQALAVATIDTGQGAVECYAMDHAVRTTDDVTFASVTSTGSVDATGRIVTTGSGLVVQGQTNLPTGKSLELGYSTGLDYAFCQSFDRTGVAYKPLRLVGSSVESYSGTTKILDVTSTGAAVTGAITATGGITFNSSALIHRTTSDLDTTGAAYYSLQDNSTGSYIERGWMGFGAGDGGVDIANATAGQVHLRNTGGRKLSTTNDGVSVTGAISATGAFNQTAQGTGSYHYVNRTGTTTIQTKFYQVDATGITTSRGTSTGTYAHVTDTGNYDCWLSTTNSGGSGGKIVLDADTIEAKGFLDAVSNSALPAARVTNQDTTNGFGLKINAGGSAAGRYALTVNDAADTTTYMVVSTATGSVGSVGIGTASPTQKLHIDFANSSGYLFLDSGFNGNELLLGVDSFDAATFYARTSAGGDLPFIFHGGASEYMRILANGNVGIGASPAEILHVQKDGTGNYATTTIRNANSTASLNIGVAGSAVANGVLQNNAYVMNAAASKLIIGTNDTAAITVQSDQNVDFANGVDVTGSINATNSVKASGYGIDPAGGGYHFDTITGNNYLGMFSGNFQIYLGGNPRLTVNSSGRLDAQSGVVVASGQNTLANYLEGTYTATLTCTTSGTVTLSSSFDTLSYTRIGNRCYVSGYIEVSSVSSPTGELRLNLPFTVADLSELGERAAFPVFVSNSVSKNANQFVLIFVAGASYVDFFSSDGNTIGVTLAGQMKAGTEITISGWFPVA